MHRFDFRKWDCKASSPIYIYLSLRVCIMYLVFIRIYIFMYSNAFTACRSASEDRKLIIVQLVQEAPHLQDSQLPHRSVWNTMLLLYSFLPQYTHAIKYLGSAYKSLIESLSKILGK